MTAVRRPVEVDAMEIAEAIHEAKTLELYEVPARVKRAGRWRSVLVMFEAEDRESARRQLAAFASLIQIDARKLRRANNLAR